MIWNGSGWLIQNIECRPESWQVATYMTQWTPPYRGTLAGCSWESCTNSASWCSALWNCVKQSQVSHHSNVFDPRHHPTTPSSTAPPAQLLWLSVWLVRQSGIPCQAACGIQLLAGIVSDNLWRRFCSQRTDAFSALEVSRRCAINPLFTYLFTSRSSEQFYLKNKISVVLRSVMVSPCAVITHDGVESSLTWPVS